MTADTPSLLAVKDGAGASRNLGIVVDGSGTEYPWNAIRVDGTIAGASYPLPAVDVATGALLTTANGYLASVVTAFAGTATTALQTAGNTLLTAISGYLSTIAGTVAAGKVAVSGTVGLSGSLPDTAGGSLAAIAAAEAAGNASLATIATANTTLASAVSAGRVLTADGNMTPCGVYQHTVTSAATLASLVGGTLPTGARIVWILPEIGSNVRWRDDGIAPTASIGMPISAGQAWPYEGTLSALQIVSQSGTATVNLWFVG